jgi:hypothetical protein
MTNALNISAIGKPSEPNGGSDFENVYTSGETTGVMVGLTG